MAHRSSPFHRWFAVFLFVLLLVAACTPAQSSTETPPPAAAETDTPASTATDEPTETPLPKHDRLLFIGNTANGSTEQNDWLRSFAEENDLLFESRPSLEAGELTDEIRIVVYGEPAGDLSALLAAAPETQFVVIGGGETQAGGNLSIIVADPAQVAFLGGYIAEMISPDFRAAGLFPNEGGSLAEAFVNGGHYFCGRCVPIYAPVIFFPLVGSAAGGSPADVWISAFEEVHKNRIETVFLSRQAASQEVMAHLAQQQITILSETAPPEELRSAVAAVIQMDAMEALQNLLPELLAGSGGLVRRAPLVLSSVDENRITPGKQQLIQAVIDDLAGGWIHPNSIPME